MMYRLKKRKKSKQVFEIMDGVFMNIVPYDFLKDIKLRSIRHKHLYDIARLEEIRKKNKFSLE